MVMETVFVALGSNLGNRSAYLHLACEQIAQLSDTGLLAMSPVYETEPADNHPQPKYLNQVIQLETSLTAVEMLTRLLQIEQTLGRVRDSENRYASRTIDLDLLFYGQQIIDLPQLQVPHPRISERLFVLQPLCDVAPHWVHPQSLKTMTELMVEQTRTQGLIQI